MRLLRDVQVADKLGIGRSTVWRKSKTEAAFPKPVQLPGGRLTGWVEAEIDGYLSDAIAESRRILQSRKVAA